LHADLSLVQEYSEFDLPEGFHAILPPIGNPLWKPWALPCNSVAAQNGQAS